MTAYAIAFVDVKDAEQFAAYQGVASSSFADYGAKFLTSGSIPKILEGAAEGRTCVIVEFPSMEQAEAFWYSDAYQAAIKLREGAADMQVLLLEGGE